MRRGRRWLVRALVALIVAFAGWRWWKQHRLDTDFALAEPVLRPCLSQLPEEVLGYAVDDDHRQAVSWGKKYLGLCDAMHEADDGIWARNGAYVLEKRGISAVAFIDTELWLGFPGRLEHLGFGPPTGGDGALYLWDDEPPIAIDLDGPPVKLKPADAKNLLAISATGKFVTVPMPR